MGDETKAVAAARLRGRGDAVAGRDMFLPDHWSPAMVSAYKNSYNRFKREREEQDA